MQYSSDEDDEREAVNITLEDEANNLVAFLGNLIYILRFQRMAANNNNIHIMTVDWKPSFAWKLFFFYIKVTYST